MRRHARRGLAAGAAVGAVVFLAFAYIPGTEESLLYWAALAVVLASAVAALVTTVMVARAARRRTRAVQGVEHRRRSPATLAALVGLLGWVLVWVGASVGLEEPSAGLRLVVALVTSGFAALVVGGLAVRLAVALSLSHAWRPGAAAGGAVAYTALVAAPAVGCPSGGPCLDTPEGLVAAVVGADPGVVAPSYAAVVVAGGLLVGAVLGRRGASPPHAVAAGVVATVAVLPLVAAASGDPVVVRMTSLYLPALLGGVAAAGAAAAPGARSRDDIHER